MKLKAKDIDKEYNGEQILQGIDLSVSSGESVAITGQSGKGKSTLLSILGLLLQPSSGALSLDDKDLLQLSDRERSHIRNRVFGFLFQHTQLVGSVTVLDNVLIPALLARKKGMESRAEDLLEQLGLDDRLQYYPHQLSIGQRRRVSLARALLMKPNFVFADEPTNDLDEENARVVGDQLFQLTEGDTALLLVTHDQTLASMADRQLSL